MRRKSLTIQLDNDLYEQVSNLAKENRIAIAAQIRLILASQLKEQEKCLDTSIKDKTK